MQTDEVEAMVDKAWGRFEAELKRGQRAYPLDVQCLYTDDTKTLMSKGHHDEAEFMRACEEWYGVPLNGWGKVRHGWGRTVPDRTGEYTYLMLPAKPHARGAYPVTTIIDDPAYDHDDEDSKTPNVLDDRPAAPFAAGPESEANEVERRVRAPVATEKEQ